MSPSRDEELFGALDALCQEARGLPRGADLGGFLDREVTRFARLLREKLADENQDAACSQAAFPPSDLSGLREREDIEPGSAQAPGPDDPR